jgi:3'-5' exoribonuclease
MTKKSLFVQDLPEKGDIHSLFLVKYLGAMKGKDGKSYLNIVLSDNSGDIESRKWHGAEEIIDKIQKGDFVEIQGKMNVFQGKRQLIVMEINKLSPEKINKEDFILKSNFDPEAMFSELLKIVDSLPDVYIRDLLKNILHDQEISKRLKVWQAGKSIHHAYQSGLLEHILSCSKLGVSLSAHYKVKISFVIAGCILHDLCKIYELTEGPVVEYTEEGKLVGHLVKGLELVDIFSAKINQFPIDTKIHLKHILLSHHGEFEYGSPKIPQTSEAFLVHLIDLMDSKMNSLESIKRSDQNAGAWSGMVKHLDRTVYKDELPTYKDYLTIKSQHIAAGPLKQTLASKLAGFKTDHSDQE